MKHNLTHLKHLKIVTNVNFNIKCIFINKIRIRAVDHL